MFTDKGCSDRKNETTVSLLEHKSLQVINVHVKKSIRVFEIFCCFSKVGQRRLKKHELKLLLFNIYLTFVIY